MNFKKIIDTKNVTVSPKGLVSPIIDIPDNWTRLNNTKILAEVLKCLKSDTDKHFVGFLTYCYYNLLPDYFFVTPASSTGKYHPAFANKENGLVRHSLATTLYAVSMLSILELDPTISETLPSDVYNDIVIAAFLHDMFKYGDPETYTPGDYTCHEHPALAAAFFRSEELNNVGNEFGLTKSDLEFIASIIHSHMGPWNTSKYSDVVLPTPQTSFEMLLFKADHFASMKEGDILPNMFR